MSRRPPKSTEAERNARIPAEAILKRFEKRIYDRGKDYARRGAVFDGRREAQASAGGPRAKLTAKCEGSSANYYRTEAVVAGGRVESADCTCPVGEDGFCKHVVALLLTWRKSPDDFVETEDPRAALARRTKAELIDLIAAMLARQPDLRSLLELTPPAAAKSAPVGPDPYRRRVVAAFRAAGYGWEADDMLTAEVQNLVQIAAGFRDRGEPASAAAVCAGVLAGFAAEYETFEDETRNVVAAAAGGCELLAGCLPDLADRPADRERAVAALFEFLRFDSSGAGWGPPTPPPRPSPAA